MQLAVVISAKETATTTYFLLINFPSLQRGKSGPSLGDEQFYGAHYYA